MKPSEEATVQRGPGKRNDDVTEAYSDEQRAALGIDPKPPEPPAVVRVMYSGPPGPRGPRGYPGPRGRSVAAPLGFTIACLAFVVGMLVGQCGCNTYSSDLLVSSPDEVPGGAPSVDSGGNGSGGAPSVDTGQGGQGGATECLDLPPLPCVPL